MVSFYTSKQTSKEVPVWDSKRNKYEKKDNYIMDENVSFAVFSEYYLIQSKEEWDDIFEMYA